jgi:hypothetical protein
VALSPYRRDTPQCSVCGTTLDPADCLLSFTGQLICDHCFVVQSRPLAELHASEETGVFEPPLRRRALWTHAFLRVLVPGGLLAGGGLLAAHRALVTTAAIAPGWLLVPLGLVATFALSRRAIGRASTHYARGSLPARPTSPIFPAA